MTDSQSSSSGEWTVVGKKSLPRSSTESSQQTKTQSTSHSTMARQREPYPFLSCSKEHLQTLTSPALTSTSEVACYSTKLNPGPNPVSTQPEGQSSSVSENQKYLVQGAYSRALCEDDKANLKHRGTMQPPFVLGKGYGTQKEKKLENEFLSLLLECLVQKNLVGQSKFVASRRVLMNISSTPYDAQNSEDDNGVLVVVQKIGGVFYMIERATQKAETKERSADEALKKKWYWGMKFESYMTAKSEQDVKDPMDYNREFCTVVKTQLGTHSIILRGEIDCCNSDDKSYVELKTSKTMPWKSVSPDKLMKWWLQISLVGVKSLICGFRDHSGCLNDLHTYSVAELESMMSKSRLDVCMHSLDQFLSFTKANVKVDFKPHVFERAPGSSTFKMKIDEKGEYKFIPQWFAKHSQLKTA